MHSPDHHASRYRQSDHFELPDSDRINSAVAGPRDSGLHNRLRLSCPVLNTVRVQQPGPSEARPEKLRVVAWNLERCKHVEASAGLISATGADVALLTEMDIGMARSGNRDTVADLAALLGMGHAAAVEFLELGLGDAREEVECHGMQNSGGLHCNAVLSCQNIGLAEVVHIGSGNDWLAGRLGKGQPRIGGRIAVMVKLFSPKPIWVVAVHFESEDGPQDRAAEATHLVAGIDNLCGDAPVVIGGDFNFNRLTAAGLRGQQLLTRPHLHEPAFTVLQDGGFSWADANTTEMTTRRHPWQHDFIAQKIDWIFVRGVKASNPRVRPACTSSGENLSDHEMLAVDISW